MELSIFISYAHADKIIAREIASELASRKVKVWIDEGELRGTKCVAKYGAKYRAKYVTKHRARRVREACGTCTGEFTPGPRNGQVVERGQRLRIHRCRWRPRHFRALLSHTAGWFP